MSDLTITEFLLARVAEREVLARAALEKSENTGDRQWYVDGPAAVSGKHWIYATGEKFTHREIADFIATNDPRFVLAECEAKRRIIERYAHLAEWGNSGDAEWVLTLLAQPYADHPDFDPSWKVQ